MSKAKGMLTVFGFVPLAVYVKTENRERGKKGFTKQFDGRETWTNIKTNAKERVTGTPIQGRNVGRRNYNVKHLSNKTTARGSQ